jgi:hypothetical protein
LKGSETIEFQTFKLGAGVLFTGNTPATAGLPWWRIQDNAKANMSLKFVGISQALISLLSLSDSHCKVTP